MGLCRIARRFAFAKTAVRRLQYQAHGERHRTEKIWRLAGRRHLPRDVGDRCAIGPHLGGVKRPVPAGASILGSGLGGDSAQLASGEKKLGWQRPSFEERAFDGFRAYYRYVPKGKFTIEYSVRLNNAGHFEMPATRVEAMYAPEVFGESPVAKMDVLAAGK